MDLTLFITSDGMEKLQRRIAFLMNDERPKVIKALAIAREFGDLSENAEYKAARESQRAIDGEIDYLRRRAAHLKVIDSKNIPKDMVRFGAYCRAIDTETGEELLYRVVGVEELSFSQEEGVMAVSVVSPIGKALLGKKIGEIAAVMAPMGIRQLEIKEIK
ncbi:MAG: transcription elongation factor [Candidatus Cloacimonetes bacterium HGW-Cloacimonetes-2]|jgi:transcription elongation factor GreA|nr:MAG: transcription elongation factor [Candidatus Cloacimonetes bacterium HGW-Cloacimonetes-2]